MVAVIAWGPWWLMAIGIVVGIIYFPKYYEAIIFGIIIDSVYGISEYNVKYTLAAILLLAIYVPLRKRFRTNS
jgi:hypothetical protein